LYGRGTQVSFGPPTTPDVIKVLLIANIGVYIGQRVLGNALIAWFAVWPELVWEQGFIWQPFTYMWLHDTSSVMHLLFNMFALWMFGSPVAEYWGTKKFVRFYMICGVGAGFIIAAWPALLYTVDPQTLSYRIPTLGASGAIFGVLLAYSMLWPDRRIMLLFPPIPLKAIYFIPFLFLMELILGNPNVSHVGHLGGVVVGWILLSRDGVVKGLGLQQLKYRWRRYRLRKQLRAVRTDDHRDTNRRTYH
jgi:membrane associated rhomboid family serine protease